MSRFSYCKLNLSICCCEYKLHPLYFLQECQFWDGLPITQVKKLFTDYQSPDHEQLEYTDDTAMARQVADSIIASKAVDPQNLAQRFVTEYFKEPKRGYGASVAAVFKKLKQSQCQDPFQPASEQFNGSGSYGNGAAMRVHPVGMYCFEKSNESIIEEVTNSAKVTHTHLDAINGAVLQAACVSWALQGLKAVDIRKKAFDLCSNFDKPDSDENDTYVKKVKKMDAFFEHKEDDIKLMIDILGNDVAALGSVPTAVFAFLAGIQNISLPAGLETSENPFERTLQFAMCFGGDADTIMSMAGALAGAYYGESGIPDYMKIISEGVDNAVRQADQLHKLVAQ